MRRDLILEILDQTDGVFAVLLAHDGDFLVFVLDSVAREHRALERVDEADARIPFAIQRDGRVGCGCGQRGNFVLGKDLAARHRQTGAVGAKHCDYALIHEGLRGQRRFGAVRLVVAVDQLDLLAQHIRVKLIGEIETFFFHRAAGGGRAGHRLKDTNLYGILRHRHGRAEQSSGKQHR